MVRGGTRDLGLIPERSRESGGDPGGSTGLPGGTRAVEAALVLMEGVIPEIWGRFRGGAGGVPQARAVPGIWKQAWRRREGRSQESGGDSENFGAIPGAVSTVRGGTGEEKAAPGAIPEAVPRMWGRSRGRSRAGPGLPTGRREEDSGALPWCAAGAGAGSPRAVPKAVPVSRRVVPKTTPRHSLGEGPEPVPGASGGAKGGPRAEPIAIAALVPVLGQRRSPGHGGPGRLGTGHRTQPRSGHSRGTHGVLQVAGPRREPAPGGGGVGRRWCWRCKVLGGTGLHCGVGVAAVAGCWNAQRGTGERRWRVMRYTGRH